MNNVSNDFVKHLNAILDPQTSVVNNLTGELFKWSMESMKFYVKLYFDIHTYSTLWT